MDSETGSPPSKRQQLAGELRHLRCTAGVSGRTLARRIGMSQSKVSRIEACTALPSLREVQAWSEALDASTATKHRLVALAEAVFAEVNPWQAALRSDGGVQNDIRELESHARSILTFQPSVVPGLLQTAEYARRVFTLAQGPYAETDVAASVSRRLHRQVALYEESKQFEFLITEAALRWRPGPSTLLLAQLDRIASISTLRNVRIGIIPQNREAHTLITHGFIIFNGVDDEDSVVQIDTIHAHLTLREQGDVDPYRYRWPLLREMAIFDGEARHFLVGLASEIQATTT